jgi:serine/threonine protein kinase
VLYDSSSGRIKVIDFGISKYVVERGTQVNMFTNTGTLYYKAPEMFLGGGYDEKVDMWALGATVYKIVTKRTPF